MAFAYAVFAQFLSLEVTALFKKNNIYINSPLGDFDRCLIENNMLSGRTLKVHISLLTVKLHQLEYIYIQKLFSANRKYQKINMSTKKRGRFEDSKQNFGPTTHQTNSLISIYRDLKFNQIH